jgi:hypothetical protein
MSTVIANHVHKMVENYVVSIVDKIANRYGIPRQELMDLMKTVDTSTTTHRSQKTIVTTIPSRQIPVVTSNKKQLSGYVKFCKEHRQQLKEDQPTLKFGDISKELGRIWSTLTSEEKKKYDSTDTELEDDSNSDCTTVKINTTPSSKLGEKTSVNISTDKYTKVDLDKKTLTELKDLCGKFNLKKSGKKDAIVERILEHTVTLGESSIPRKENVDTNAHDTIQIEDDNNTLIFYENDSSQSSDNVSATSSTSFVLDDDDNDLPFDFND